jgi:hypothetical protein
MTPPAPLVTVEAIPVATDSTADYRVKKNRWNGTSRKSVTQPARSIIIKTTYGGITEDAGRSIDQGRQELTFLDLDGGFSEDRAGHHGDDGGGEDDGFDGNHFVEKRVCVCVV